MTSPRSPAVEVAGLVREFKGGIRAVDGLDLEVAEGEIYGFLGPNGAGKTTSVRILTTLLRPTAGVARVAGHDVVQDADVVRRQIGVALQEAAIDPLMTGRELLRMQGALHGLRGPAARDRAAELLERVGMTQAADRRVGGYSMGMRQRLGIAAALLGDPEVLILDEPTNGLDPPGIAWMRGMLREQATRGRAVLVSSHLLAEVAQSVDDVVVISQGEMRAQGTLAQVLGGDEGQSTAVRSQDDDRLAQALQDAGHTVHRDGEGLLVPGASPEQVGVVAGDAGVYLVGLAPKARSLEQAFFALTGDAA
jgi:ABC-2 type transport system ATP-binding protein